MSEEQALPEDLPVAPAKETPWPAAAPPPPPTVAPAAPPPRQESVDLTDSDWPPLDWGPPPAAAGLQGQTLSLRPNIFKARHYGCLWWIVGFSFLVQVVIVVGALAARNITAQPLQELNDRLAESLSVIRGDPVPYEPYQLQVALNQPLSFPVADDIRFVRTLTVPVDIVLELNETIPFQDTVQVPIRTTIPVRDTLSLPISVLGLTFAIDLPVAFDVPVNLDVSTPIETSVPLSLQVPLQFTLDVPVDVLVPLRNENKQPWTMQLDLQTQVPIPTDLMVEDIGMVDMLEAFHETLNELELLMGLR